MKAPDLQDLYELTPLQHGLLFHCLYAPEEGVYVEQAYLTLHGELRRDEFWTAWQTVFDRHPALRSTYHWDGTDNPVQAVHRHADVERDERDWRDLPAADVEPHLRAFLEEERHRGLDLQAPPLMKLTLFRAADDTYYLAMRISHLIMDGWSVGIILREFIGTYRALYHGDRPALDRPGRYKDYVAWWRRQDRTAIESYWRQTLAGYEPPPPLDLGPVRPPPDAEVPYDRTDASLDDIADRLRAFCRSRQLTLHTVIQGAWMLVLARTSGQDEVVAGATMAHRPTDVPAVDAIVGPMVVTLPIRARLAADRPVREWFGQIQDAIVAARDHAGAPLTDIRAWSGLPGSAALFESIVSFENVPLPSLEFPDERLALTDYVFDGRPQYPLSFVVLPGDDLPLRLVFDRRRFSAENAGRMLARVRAVLLAVLDGPDRTAGDIDVLTAAERDLLDELHRPLHTHSAPPTLPEAVRRHAAERPDAVAVTGADPTADTLTWNQLDEQADKLAGHLVELGVTPGERVALYASRTPRAIVAIIAVLRAGGVYVPLDPQHPTGRLDTILADSEAMLLLTEAGFVERFGARRPPVVCLDSAWDVVSARPATDPGVPVGPDEPAYLVYTSGSTGTPKGALMTHANGMRLATAMDEQLDVGPDDVWTCFHTFAFDASVWEIWAALASGGRLVVVPAEVGQSGEATHDLLVREGVTVLLLTPRAFEQMIAVEPAGPTGLRLRYVLVGADRVEPTALNPWFERHGDERPAVLNVYGPTETTVFCTAHRITTAETAGAHAPSNIGRPVCDTAVYLLDPAGRPVPFGAAGEICIAGPGLGVGYLNRPDLTAERFVPDPVRGEGRMYRSGDLARYTPDGELEYLGRGDTQVKVRGYRVEPGEIEFALREHDGVRNAGVVLSGDRLVAYVVPADGAAPEEPELRDHLRRTLPPYMIPARFVSLAEIPLNANGKLDARVLPDPEPAAGGTAAQDPPRGPVEERLAAILTETLNLEALGRADNLLDLGLHSLLATGVVGRIRDEWHVPVPLRALFESPTVAALARIIETGDVDVAVDRPGQVDLAAEAELPVEIRPVGPPRTERIEDVLLTGATGVLGTALLARLLADTPYVVHCLVRAADAAEGAARLRDRLRSEGAWEPGYGDRIVAVPGDLARPLLGLSPDGFDELAGRVHAIYHCGAQVNFVQPYRLLRTGNVGGTTEVLRLAATGIPTRVHYVSTGAVLGQIRDGDGADATMLEERLDPTPPRLSGGYAQTKWVAERLVTAAGDRGLPVTVYRSGRITGNSVDGTWKPGDATAEMLRACAHLGMVPRFDGAVDMTPIDFVSAALVALSTRPDTVGRVFHLTNPVPVSIDDIGAGLVEAGYRIRSVDVPRWYAELVKLARRTPDEWVTALAVLGQWVHSYNAGLREPHYDSARTVATLAGTPACPPVDPIMITRYLRHFQSIGYVPGATAAALAGA